MPPRSPPRCERCAGACLVHTAARDLTGRADLRRSVRGDDAARRGLAARRARPPSRRAGRRARRAASTPTAHAQELIVIGMGKLGGGELNVSSDIDLVFVYPEDGETTGPRPLANGEFFDRARPAGHRGARTTGRPTASCFASTCGCGRTATADR